MAFLKLLNYRVMEISFKAAQEPEGIKTYQINPKIRMDIKQHEKMMGLAITVTVEKTPECPTPFELNVNILGNFQITNMADIDSLRIEASNMLYPYLRAAVAQITTTSNMPAYFMPIIDFAPPPNNKDSVIIRPLEDL